MPDDKPPPEDPEPPSEADLVERIAAEIARAGAPADLRDDCAHVRGETALVTTDTLVEGVHFDLARDTLAQVGAQAAVANLSDLAASGGAAGWLVWSLVLPPGYDVERVGALTRGFVGAAAAHGARLVGGNVGRTAGPLVLSVTAGGPLAGPRPLLRTGARPGHTIYVTGPLGDAALGVAEPDPEARAARHRWRPHLAEAAALARWGLVGACMDVSDGLLLDASRLARASGVAVDLDAAAIPVSPLYEARRGADRRLAMGGGEDYVLLFTAPAGAPPPIPAVAIGRCRAGAGLTVDGRPARPAGYEQFRGPVD